jgi:hypothetical protein
VRQLILLVLAIPQLAAADDGENYLIGPVLGLRLDGGGFAFGLEGGLGYGPERINFGFEHRADKMFYYGEVDPWYILGGTLGFGVDEDGKTWPVLGLWEGFPLNDGPCDGWHNQLTLAGGYRYTGVHELYVTVKAGRMDGFPCLGN